MVYPRISEHRDEYTIREKDVSFWVGGSTYYKRAKNKAPREWKEGDGELADLIRLIQERHPVWQSSGEGSPAPGLREALIYSIENAPTMLAANYIGAIGAALTQGKQSLPYLRNEMSKYIGETGKLCLPSISVKLISVSLREAGKP